MSVTGIATLLYQSQIWCASLQKSFISHSWTPFYCGWSPWHAKKSYGPQRHVTYFLLAERQMHEGGMGLAISRTIVERTADAFGQWGWQTRSNFPVCLAGANLKHILVY